MLAPYARQNRRRTIIRPPARSNWQKRKNDGSQVGRGEEFLRLTIVARSRMPGRVWKFQSKPDTIDSASG